MPDDIPSTDDPLAEENAKRAAGRQRKDDMDVLRMLMRKPTGRDWMYRFLEECHIYGNPALFDNVPGTFFNLGEQNVGKKLLVQLEAASLDLYMTMKREHEEKVADETRIVREATKRELAETEEPDITADQQPHLPRPEGWPDK